MKYYTSIKEGNPAVCNKIEEGDDLTLSELSQKEEGKYCMISLVCGIQARE